MAEQRQRTIAETNARVRQRIADQFAPASPSDVRAVAIPGGLAVALGGLALVLAVVFAFVVPRSGAQPIGAVALIAAELALWACASRAWRLYRRTSDFAAKRAAILAGQYVDVQVSYRVMRAPGVSPERRPRQYRITVVAADGRRIAIPSAGESSVDPLRAALGPEHVGLDSEPTDASLLGALIDSASWCVALGVAGLSAMTYLGVLHYF
jgi:hypothetical protein